MADRSQDRDGQEPPVWFMDQLENLIQRHHASYQEWLSRREQEATSSSPRPLGNRQSGINPPAAPDIEL